MSIPLSSRLLARTNEQAVLRSYIDRGEAQFIAVTGRRRIGKTFLVRNSIQAGETLFEVVGKKKSGSSELKAKFIDSLNETFKNTLALSSDPRWRDIFKTLSEKSQQTKTPLIVFLDELPWMAEADKSFLAELEHIWNSDWSKRDNLKLIICGSSTSWMIEKIFNNTGGFFNRLTARMELQPLTIQQCREFLSAKGITPTDQQLLEYYFALGGVPYYWNLIGKSEPPSDFFQRCLFNSDGVLRSEFNLLMEALFRDSRMYSQIVLALAESRYGMSRPDLAKEAKVSEGGAFEKALKELADCSFITRYVPFGYKEKGMYFRLSDEFTFFYSTWLKNIDFAGIKNVKDYWLKSRGTPKYYNWAGASFEMFCQKHIDQIVSVLGISGIRFEVSTWRTFAQQAKGKIQIDLVIDRSDSVVTLVECKYSERALSLTSAELEQYALKQGIFAAQTKTKKFINSVLVSANSLLDSNYAAAFYKTISFSQLMKAG